VTHVNANITIKRPAEVVFAALVDDGAHARWSSALRTKTSDGPVGVGTTYRVAGKSLGRSFELSSTVTEFEANRRFAMATRTPFIAIFTYSLTPVDGGTRVHETLDAEFSGLLKLAQPLLSQTFRRQMQGDLETLRTLIEAGAL